jgi:hypothetical protein
MPGSRRSCPLSLPRSSRLSTPTSALIEQPFLHRTSAPRKMFWLRRMDFVHNSWVLQLCSLLSLPCKTRGLSYLGRCQLKCRGGAMHRRNTLRLSNLSKTLAIVLSMGCPTFLSAAQAQYSHSFDLSTYRGNDPDARNARGFCWDKVGVPKTSSARTIEEYNALKSCIDKVHASFVPAKSGPAAQSPRGNCIRDLPGSRYNRETGRFSNADIALVNSKCGSS